MKATVNDTELFYFPYIEEQDAFLQTIREWLGALN